MAPGVASDREPEVRHAPAPGRRLASARSHPTLALQPVRAHPQSPGHEEEGRPRPVVLRGSAPPGRWLRRTPSSKVSTIGRATAAPPASAAASQDVIETDGGVAQAPQAAGAGRGKAPGMDRVFRESRAGPSGSRGGTSGSGPWARALHRGSGASRNHAAGDGGRVPVSSPLRLKGGHDDHGGLARAGENASWSWHGPSRSRPMTGYRIRVRALVDRASPEREGHAGGARGRLRPGRSRGLRDGRYRGPSPFPPCTIRRHSGEPGGWRPDGPGSRDPRTIRPCARRSRRPSPGARFDLIQIEGSEFADLPFPAESPVVVDEHNIWSELTERRRRVRAVPRASAGSTPTKPPAPPARGACLGPGGGRRVLLRARGRPGDRASPDGRFAVVPNGVDTEAVPPGSARPPPIPGRLAFVGFLRYTPERGCGRLARRGHPAARSAAGCPTHPSTSWASSRRRHTLALADAATGDPASSATVPDVRPLLAAASVVVVPLRVGSGTRIKILEAMAMGRPVVATSLGAEGLGAQDGVHLLIADTPLRSPRRSPCSSATRRFARDSAAAGREFVLHGHTWDASVARLMDLHDEVLATTRPTT